MRRFYLGQEHVADGENGFDSAEELLLLVLADGAEFLQGAGVDVVNRPEGDQELALGIHQVFRQAKARVHLCISQQGHRQ